VRVGALGRRGGCSVAGSDARAAVIFLPQRKSILNNLEAVQRIGFRLRYKRHTFLTSFFSISACDIMAERLGISERRRCLRVAKFRKRTNAFFKRRWREEVLKHRWRAMKMALPKWRESFRFPTNIRAFLFGLKMPPQERLAQLKAYAERLKRTYPSLR